MTEPLGLFKEFLGVEIVDKLDKWRRNKKEIQRKRILGTIEMLWLFICMAADSRSRSIAEIIRLNLLDCGLNFSISEAAFCKARKRFSPKGVI